jgi:hypothetical protein
LPDITEDGKAFVSLCLTSNDWTARLDVSSQPQSATQQVIPPNLRSLDAGSVAVEMLSQMFLGHSWLPTTLTPDA